MLDASATLLWRRALEAHELLHLLYWGCESHIDEWACCLSFLAFSATSNFFKMMLQVSTQICNEGLRCFPTPQNHFAAHLVKLFGIVITIDPEIHPNLAFVVVE